MYYSSLLTVMLDYETHHHTSCLTAKASQSSVLQACALHNAFLPAKEYVTGLILDALNLLALSPCWCSAAHTHVHPTTQTWIALSPEHNAHAKRSCSDNTCISNGVTWCVTSVEANSQCQSMQSPMHKALLLRLWQ